jgi:hypothetical protein
MSLSSVLLLHACCSACGNAAAFFCVVASCNFAIGQLECCKGASRRGRGTYDAGRGVSLILLPRVAFLYWQVNTRG